MESTLLQTPTGIAARMGWDPRMELRLRIRALARELVSARLGVDPATVHVDREAPAQFGYHTQLIATIDEKEVPLLIKTASHRAASIVAIADPTLRLGLDISDVDPDEATMRDIRRHSALVADQSDANLVAHWSRVQAVLQADQRGVRVHPEYVRFDGIRKGWIPDRKEVYQLADLSNGGFVVTLAYGPVVD
jgi:4'-phosphopantetheinyl transferase